MSVRLEWDGKPTRFERISLPFQTVETINESRATRERDEGSLLGGGAQDASWRNQLIWGDNKLVMSSLLKEYAGKVNLVYIDPPFATGDDFRLRLSIGDADIVKEPSILEEHALPRHVGFWLRLLPHDDVRAPLVNPRATRPQRQHLRALRLACQ